MAPITDHLMLHLRIGYNKGFEDCLRLFRDRASLKRRDEEWEKWAAQLSAMPEARQEVREEVAELATEANGGAR